MDWLANGSQTTYWGRAMTTNRYASFTTGMNGPTGTTGGPSFPETTWAKVVESVRDGALTAAHPKQSLCLVLIVKDEEKVIERCLRSTLPIITSWSIVDTGSTDRTKEIIREVLKDIPGELHERPWKNFAYNRSEMIELARGKAAYNVMLDADDTLEIPEGFELPELTLDKYDLPVKFDNITMPRPHIFKNDDGFFYESILHEYLHKKDKSGKPVPLNQQTCGFIEGLVYRVIGGGVRGRDPVAKYKRDAELLKAELLKDPSNHLAPRYAFYLAQSYKDVAIVLLGQPNVTATNIAEATKYRQKALKAYERRAAMGSYFDEVFISLLEIGKLHEQLKSGDRAIVDAYIKAYEYLPHRGAEPLYYLAKYYRAKNRFHLAYLYAKVGVTIPQPLGLFIDFDIYAWRIWDELAVASYFTDRYAESYDVNKQLLDHGGVLDSEVPRLEQNMIASKEKLEALGCAVS